ncbi:MAG: ADP-ribosylglycohydrolase family protein [Desulfococcaceae bacterium]
MVHDLKASCTGCILGTAAGDALGLPYEGIGPRRAARLFPDTGRHHFFFGKGMVSDDTEHACFTAQALIRGRGQAEVFEKRLAWSLRWWLINLPAGTGLATLKATLKLWMGFPPRRSGVFSAGNGPAMRSPILGVALGHAPDDLRRFVRASTRITHTDPKAFHGALAVALAACQSAVEPVLSPDRFVEELTALLAEEPAEEFLQLVRQALQSAAEGEPVSAFADRIGSSNGISGYIFHTVSCVLQVWFRYPEDFAGGIQEIIAGGGDADSTAAILGGIIGARVGRQGIPESWLNNLMEWPRSVAWMERLGEAVAASSEGHIEVKSPGYFVPGIPLRNLWFLLTVLFHGFRRLLPPY